MGASTADISTFKYTPLTTRKMSSKTSQIFSQRSRSNFVTVCDKQSENDN